METQSLVEPLSRVNMSYFLLFFVTWLTSQTLKYILSLYKRKKVTLKHVAQTYLYSSGVPSTHTSLLTSTFLYMVGRHGFSDPLTYLVILFGIMWIFEIYLQRRRFSVLATFLEIPEDKQADLLLLKDLNGHDFVDIFVGVLVGGVVYFTFFISGL
jgi:acid phosphatase family membrane protein YuiD